jgi:hypothetical protein
VELTAHPVAVLAVAWACTAAGGLLLRRTSPAARRGARAAAIVCCYVVLACSCAIGIWYATRTTYMDPAEPTIPAVAAVFGAGQPLYPALTAPERYAHIYGPDLFIVQSVAMALFGEDIRVSKAVGVLAFLVSVLLAYRLFATRAGPSAAAIAAAACALILLSFGNAAFWTRPDPLLLCCTVIGLYACGTPGTARTIVWLGIATGVAVNLKLSGPLYLVPAYFAAYSRHSVRAIAGAALLAAVIALIPYLAPTVSLTHFLEYFQLSARNGLVGAKLRQNLEWAVFLLIPVAAVAFAARRAAVGARTSASLVVGLGVAVGVVAVLAAKPGAGPYHFLPFAPVLAYAALDCPPELWRARWLSSLGAAMLLAAFVIALPRQITFVRTVLDRDRNDVAADLRRFADANSGKRIAVGYAGTSYFAFARPVIVFRTHEYLIDAPAIQEHRLSGADLPASTYQAIAECRDDAWLIPDGGQPFDVPSAYWPDGPRRVFPDAFRQTFVDHYHQTGRTAYFTVWECSATRDQRGR